MTEIEELKAQIKVLEAKLSFLEEMEKHKSPCEEAYKRVYGFYPETYEDSWSSFQDGYIASQKDIKVGKFQPTPQTPEQVEQGLRDAMKQAKKDGVFDDLVDEPDYYDEIEWDEKDNPKPMDDVIDRLLEKYKSQKLWNMMRNELGYSIDCCDEIVDLVERWLPKEQSAEGSQNAFAIDATEGFNHCLNKIKGTLR